jgi:hypothetical protein
MFGAQSASQNQNQQPVNTVDFNEITKSPLPLNNHDHPLEYSPEY